MSSQLQLRIEEEAQERLCKHVLVSIHPVYAELILKGRKTVEFRRRFPAETLSSSDYMWIYATAPVQSVVGYVEISRIERRTTGQLWRHFRTDGGIDRTKFDDYFNGVSHGYAIVLGSISKLANPVDAPRLESLGLRAPQSFRYIPSSAIQELTGVSREAVTGHKYSHSA